VFVHPPPLEDAHPPAFSPCQRPQSLFLFLPQCYTRLHHSPMIATPRQTGGAILCGAGAETWVSPCVPSLHWVAAPLDVLRRRKGEPMTEEGTLSIVRRGTGYQVRYASNTLHDRERRPRAYPDEAHLAALHHFGTEVAVISQVCADVRQGKMAVLLVVISAEQLQAFFPETHQANSATRSACHASISPPDAAVLRQDSQRSSSRPPRSHALWVHARETRGEAEQLREEFALLLEEAALLLEETALAVGASHQLLEKCHE
jgi:hypothetical protein